jgi:hypothetical protein
MTGRLLLVDYENVQSLQVDAIPPDVRVHVVLGAKQKPVVAKVRAKLKPLGDRATVNRIRDVPPLSVAGGSRVHRHCKWPRGQLLRVLGWRQPAQ